MIIETPEAKSPKQDVKRSTRKRFEDSLMKVIERVSEKENATPEELNALAGIAQALAYVIQY